MEKILNTTTTEISEIDQVRIDTLKFDNTSKKIRYLSSIGKDTKTIYNLLKKFEVTTKDGNEIRYQHVRNVLMTKLSSDQ